MRGEVWGGGSRLCREGGKWFFVMSDLEAWKSLELAGMMRYLVRVGLPLTSWIGSRERAKAKRRDCATM